LELRLRRGAASIRVHPATLGSLTIRLVDDQTIAKLNARFMGVSGPTDVLSFPADDPRGREAREIAELGDIALSWDAVVRQAQGGRTFTDEATLLCLHGLAHLLGHDHGSRSDGRAMLRLERRALRAARTPDIPRPYGGRA
jgi:probable rRNA maturation factor